jgi:hypothetical protein
LAVHIINSSAGSIANQSSILELDPGANCIKLFFLCNL